MASMGRQMAGFDGSQAGRNCQLFLTDNFNGHGQLSQLSTLESTGTNSSQYSVPHINSPFENYMPPLTSTSSLESAWSNVQANNEHGKLVKQCELLAAKNAALKEAYEYLVAWVPTSFTEHVIRKREDYPNISYWFHHEYLAALAKGKITSIDDAPIKAQGAELNEADEDNDGEEGVGVHEQAGDVPKRKRGKGQASQGENVKMRYIQHENGKIIDGWRGAEICRYARSIFVGFAMDSKLFSSWVEGSDVTSWNNYYHYMVARFPELGLCELDWKSEQIAGEIYSQWHTHWINKQEMEKTKGKTSSKRLLEETSKDDPSHKKTKVSESMSKSASLDPSSVDLSDLLKTPQINIIPDMPTRPALAMGQAATGNQFLTVDPAVLTSSDTRPQYQFSPILHTHLKASRTLTNTISHTFSSRHSRVASRKYSETPKQPNKMRVNKHSITPRNLCAKEWVEVHHGTVEEFAAYFSALPSEELERFKALSKSLETA
ncbi:hypothetical protein CPB84DRAFT_1852272 [Gymnopilus junonius]|uniref:Uncharacterized protein n=1 Tax=Gymnopilus junonius TaxID=109634 RepID=A0A9P5THM6_GYMJU|nr:hypothetical protein CPB84DRAFT_1852272 [Gymnopilus junonius]